MRVIVLVAIAALLVTCWAAWGGVPSGAPGQAGQQQVAPSPPDEVAGPEMGPGGAAPEDTGGGASTTTIVIVVLAAAAVIALIVALVLRGRGARPEAA